MSKPKIVALVAVGILAFSWGLYCAGTYGNNPVLSLLFAIVGGSLIGFLAEPLAWFFGENDENKNESD